MGFGHRRIPKFASNIDFLREKNFFQFLIRFDKRSFRENIYEN